MLKLRFIDGRLFDAIDALDFVQMLRNSSFTPSKTLEAYMCAIARRTMILMNVIIRTDVIQNFVDDLIDNGIVVIEMGKEN